MSTTKWTDSQRKAIDIRKSNTLVSAAAGSGKTAVLVQRVINIITDENNPVYINNLLVATFTNAAAAEMRERIYAALQNKIAENPENTFLREQLMLFGQAQISTVHSFCINLLRENFHLLGIRHDFDIADEVRLNEMKNIAVQSVLEKHYTLNDEEFLKVVDTFGGKKSDENLIDLIFQLSTFADSIAYPEKWLNDCYKIPKNIDEYKAYITDSIKEKLLDIIMRYRAAIDCIESDAGLEPYFPLFSDELDAFENMYQEFDNADKVSALMNSFVFDKLPRKKSGADEENVSLAKNARDYAKKNFDYIRDMYTIPDEEIMEDVKKMIPFIKTVCSITLEFRSEYNRLKTADNVMDFSDLEHYSIRLLDENEDVRNELKEKYTEIFVDEYQDTNAVQAHLFELISNGSNLFMVGDVKQSIYSFRNSNPEFFVQKYNEFDFDGNEYGTKILLSQNFRSSNGVLGFVNSIFKKIMSVGVGGVDYNDEHKLRYGNTSVKDIDSSYEVHIIDPATDDFDELHEDEKQLDKTHIEAIFTADRIIDLVEREKPEIYDKNTGQYRSIEYRDIAVLMRKTKGVATVYADVFASRGIPVFTEETGGYFNSIEIATVMSFLKIIENPLQDVPMLAVMRSPIYSFDDNTIAEIRAENRYESFYKLLKKSGNKKAEAFINDIEELANLSMYHDVEYIIRKIIFDTGYYHFVGGLPDGYKRMLNLRLLCERAGAFSKSGYKSILKFIRYVESMIAGGKEYSSAKMISESDNVVTIMTIHKSKGLEFPVVFLCGCGTDFNKTDLRKPFIYDDKLGVAADIIDVKRHLKYTPYVKDAISVKKSRELISEEVRLLYVALTRAKYKIIITGTIGKAYTKYQQLRSRACVPGTFKDETNYIQWISNAADDVCIHTAEEIISADRNICNEFVQSDNGNGDYSEFYDEIDRRLCFKYGHETSKYIPSKKSISEIASLDDDTIHLECIKQRDGGLTSAQTGTVVHYVLQNIDLNNAGSIESINKQIESMIEKGMLEKDYKEIIDTEAIFGFFTSEIGKRMLRSNKVYREFKFCVDIPSDELGYENPDEKILVQGVIDCCFLEEDGFVVIDYKTGSMQEKYKRQLELYRRCLEIATGKNVKETCIYPLI